VLAEAGDMLAGFGIGCLSRDGAGHVVTLDVHPRERRRGVGKIVLEELLSRLRRGGARRAILEVAEENLGAIAFYETLGFRRRRRLPDYYAPRRPALEMEKDLRALHLGSDRKSTRLNSSHEWISYSVFCLKKQR